MTAEWLFVAQMLVFYLSAAVLGAFVYWLAKRDSRRFDERAVTRQERKP